MQYYISLLRGINVSGKNIITQSELKGFFLELGYENVRTYIQSGNIIFSTNKVSVDVLEKQIYKKIKELFGYKIPTIVRSYSDYQKVIKDNPFSQSKIEDTKKYHVTFLSKIPKNTTLDDLDEYKTLNEELYLIGKEIYLYYPNGYGRTKMNNNFFEKTLGVTATTRNWKTVKTLERFID